MKFNATTETVRRGCWVRSESFLSFWLKNTTLSIMLIVLYAYNFLMKPRYFQRNSEYPLHIGKKNFPANGELLFWQNSPLQKTPVGYLVVNTPLIVRTKEPWSSTEVVTKAKFKNQGLKTKDCSLCRSKVISESVEKWFRDKIWLLVKLETD